MKAILSLTASWLAVVTASAQNYSIDWFTIDGGGGVSSGGGYTLSGTIGQPDAATLSGGGYTLIGGFWSLVAAIPTSAAPPLTITRDLATGVVKVSWDAATTAFVLEETDAPSGPPGAPWTEVSTMYHTNAGKVFIEVPSPIGHRFYRLHKP